MSQFATKIDASSAASRQKLTYERLCNAQTCLKCEKIWLFEGVYSPFLEHICGLLLHVDNCCDEAIILSNSGEHF